LHCTVTKIRYGISVKTARFAGIAGATTKIVGHIGAIVMAE
jgi:hypothetical protein